MSLGFTWIDILAVVPWVTEKAIVAAMGRINQGVSDALKILRVFRTLRVFKLLRMGNAAGPIQLVYNVVGAGLKDSSQLLVALVMVSVRPCMGTVCCRPTPCELSRGAHTLAARHAASVQVTLICMVVFSAALFQFEPGTDHTADVSDPAAWFLSTVRTWWWGLVTLTGVGYGDTYPMHAPGRIIAVVAAMVGVIIVAVPIEVIGRYFISHYKRFTYSRLIEDHCEVNSALSMERLHSFLLDHDRRGLLKVKAPQTTEDCERLVRLYDGKGNRKLEQEEWATLVGDCVQDPGEFTGCAVRKTMRDIHAIRQDLRQARADMEALMQHRKERMDALINLVREKHPNGLRNGEHQNGNNAIGGGLADS